VEVTEPEEIGVAGDLRRVVLSLFLLLEVCKVMGVKLEEHP